MSLFFSRKIAAPSTHYAPPGVIYPQNPSNGVDAWDPLNAKSSYPMLLYNFDINKFNEDKPSMIKSDFLSKISNPTPEGEFLTNKKGGIDFRLYRAESINNYNLVSKMYEFQYMRTEKSYYRVGFRRRRLSDGAEIIVGNFKDIFSSGVGYINITGETLDDDENVVSEDTFNYEYILLDLIKDYLTLDKYTME